MPKFLEFNVHLVAFFIVVNCIEIERDYSSHVMDDFPVYWNVPTKGCKKSNIDFEPLLRHYNIVVNDADEFRGNNINILYDPGQFPVVKEDEQQGIVLQNGGIPQKGDIDLHLKVLEEHIDKLVDKNFAGLGIIDFEVWRPVFNQNWNKQVIYKNMSIDLANQSHPNRTSKDTIFHAKEEFEAAAKQFMLKTIKKFKEKRPKAKWGYYGFPYCYNFRAKMTPECPKRAVKQNNQQMWLYNESSALYPSLYLTTELNSQQRKEFMIGVLNEAFRVASKANYPLVYPYMWFKYKDMESTFLSEDDTFALLETCKKYKMGGAIIWGKTIDSNSEDKCKNLYNYVGNVLGPSLLKSQTTEKPETNSTVTEEIHNVTETVNVTTTEPEANATESAANATDSAVTEPTPNITESANATLSAVTEPMLNVTTIADAEPTVNVSINVNFTTSTMPVLTSKADSFITSTMTISTTEGTQNIYNYWINSICYIRNTIKEFLFKWINIFIHTNPVELIAKVREALRRFVLNRIVMFFKNLKYKKWIPMDSDYGASRRPKVISNSTL